METAEPTGRKRLFWARQVLLARLGVAEYFCTIRWRDHWLVAEAERLNGQRQPQLAQARAEIATGLTPDSIRARRAAAMALSQVRHPAAKNSPEPESPLVDSLARLGQRGGGEGRIASPATEFS